MINFCASLVGKGLGAIRDDGFRAFCRKAAKHLRERLFQTNSADWYCARLTEELPRICAIDAYVDFSATEQVRSWLTDLGQEFSWVYSEAELDAARSFSHVFGLLTLGGSKAGYIKIGFSQVYVTDFSRCIAVPAGTAFIYDTFVHPDFRGRGLATFMVAESLDFLRKRDIRFAWCHIPGWNVASISTFTKCGFVKVKHIRHVRLLCCGLSTRNPEKLLRSTERNTSGV